MMWIPLFIFLLQNLFCMRGGITANETSSNKAFMEPNRTFYQPKSFERCTPDGVA